MVYKKFLIISFLIVALLSFGGCSQKPAKTEVNNEQEDEAITTEHQMITEDLMRILDHDSDLKALFEKAIAQAHTQNPDPDTNPVKDLNTYYEFIDRCYTCLPWQICPSESYSSLYDRIDQGMGLLYFVLDQPLEELKDKDYYHNSLMYHEPVRSWFIKFLEGSGKFLDSEGSWTEEYYQNALANPDFHLDDGTYEDPSNWKSFNDFFARKLADPSKRPIAETENEKIIVSPADAVPQGVWKIDENNKVIAQDAKPVKGIVIKTGKLTDVSVLLNGSEYADAFAGGTLTHTFLDVNDYHRYHMPVSGTIKEVLHVRQDDAPGGVITYDEETKHYVEYYSDVFGWQSIETRGIVILETESGGLVGIVPVGMCQVSSVNFEETIVPGAKVKKGDPLGCFLFGGSDIVILFSKDLGFELSAKQGVHLQMGEAYGTIK